MVLVAGAEGFRHQLSRLLVSKLVRERIRLPSGSAARR